MSYQRGTMMSTTKLLQSLILLLVVINIAACSNKKTAKPKPAIKHQVAIDAAEKKVYASLLDEWKKQGLIKPSSKDVVIASVKKSKAPLKPNKINKPTGKVVSHKKPKPVRKQLIRQAKHQKYKAPSYRAPVSNIRYASLIGDYAQNQQAVSFINKMSARHGFDRGYLNYLFSHTKATSFLKRMAYADAYGRKRTGKKARSGRWNRYRNNFLTKKTISKGVQFWRQNRVALQRAEQKYGVPQEYILGIIGVETRYGGNVGKNRAIDALAAMGFNNPRRGKYFQSELEAYLLMTRRTRLDPLKPMASYAGALGLSQFMPSNIKRYGVDHDGSGSVNLWTPHDAIGSVANYFKKHGWRKGGTVVVPAMSTSSGYKTLRTGFKSKHTLSRLKSRGVSANNLGNISG